VGVGRFKVGLSAELMNLSRIDKCVIQRLEDGLVRLRVDSGTIKFILVLIPFSHVQWCFGIARSLCIRWTVINDWFVIHAEDCGISERRG
jgi:hypothetical protein